MEADIKVFDVVDSTNITLSQMADEGAPEGTCVVAFCQRKGQGRSGRSFYSPEGGNLYMSFLLRPGHDEKADQITVISAVATVNAIRDKYGINCGIKWVNDIYLDGRKVCGMVAQAHNFGSDDFYVIMGIGINIYKAEDVPEDISDRYGSLFDRGCDLPADPARHDAIDLAGLIIRDFASYYEGRDLERAIEEYRRYSIVTGKRVSYICGNSTRDATALGIDDEGGIILDIDGIRKTFRDGEIRIRLTDM